LADQTHPFSTSSNTNHAKNPNSFEAGTLVIDIIDAKSHKLLQRGYATRPILRNLPEDGRSARIQKVVDEILRNVRFSP
jgi:hypothetical protein